jgi:hypothetical protein
MDAYAQNIIHGFSMGEMFSMFLSHNEVKQIGFYLCFFNLKY